MMVTVAFLALSAPMIDVTSGARFRGGTEVGVAYGVVQGSTIQMITTAKKIQEVTWW